MRERLTACGTHTPLYPRIPVLSCSLRRLRMEYVPTPLHGTTRHTKPGASSIELSVLIATLRYYLGELAEIGRGTRPSACNLGGRLGQWQTGVYLQMTVSPKKVKLNLHLIHFSPLDSDFQNL